MHDRNALQGLGRTELIHRALCLGVAHADALTRVELVAEIGRCSETVGSREAFSRSWLGAARAFTASVLERKLRLPDAAAMLRPARCLAALSPPVPLVGVVTLAEICAARGQILRAIEMLDSVLASEPDHERALRLREEFVLRTTPDRCRVEVPEAEPSSDALVTLRTNVGRSYVYWERMAREERREPRIRIVELRPTRSGTRREVRTVEPRNLVGGVVIDDIGYDALVRSAIGVEEERHFRPLTLGVEARVEDDGGIRVTWSPPMRAYDTSLLGRAASYFGE